MSTKKTNSAKAKKTSAKKEEPAKNEMTDAKTVDNLSVDELASMFIQNDTQAMNRLKEEMTAEPEQQVAEQNESPKSNTDNKLTELANEIVSESQKNDVKPKAEKKEKKKTPTEEQSKETPSQTTQNNQKQVTNRKVYGYDHFGIIYGY